MNKCAYCNGDFKTTLKEHVVRSRYEKMNELIIENLAVYECTICGHEVIPPSSEEYIAIIRQKIRNEMMKEKNEENELQNAHPSLFKRVFKRFG